MTELPAPLVADDVDLSKIDGFMLDTQRLLGSELVALSTGEEFKAAVLLWARAWQQKPNCSLPDDDRILASFAMVSIGRWKKIRTMALRGFVKCSDGRLYHRVLAADATRAWKAVQQRREAIRKRYEKATAVATEPPTDELREGYETPTSDGRGTGEGRNDSKQKEKEGASQNENSTLLVASLPLKTSNGHDPGKETRKALWQQTMTSYVNETMESERAIRLLAAWADGKKWAKVEIDRLDEVRRAREGAAA